MRFDFASDLHWDNAMGGGPHGWFDRIKTCHYRRGGDVLLIAGDTAERMEDACDFYNQAALQYQHVIAVRGNHEQGAATRLHPRVRLLDRFAMALGDICVFGGELATVQPDDLTAIRDCWRSCAHLIIISHFVPSAKIGDVSGFDLSNKSNGLIEALGEPLQPTTIVYGHSHIEFDGCVDGYHCVSMPRGYKGMRRNGTRFKRFGRVELAV